MSERYRVEPTGKGFWPYCVRAGNGTRDLYVGHKKTCDRVAAELTTAFRDGEFVGKGLYDALAAETQALREQVKALQSAANSWQSGYDEGRRMGTKHRQSEVEQLSQEVSALRTKLAMAEDAAAKGDAARQQCGGMEMEIEELRAELAELRARVAVVPDASTVYAALDARERLFTSPENIQVALEAQSRLNGMTVSEELLRRLGQVISWQCFGDCRAFSDQRIPEPSEVIEELRALLSELEGGKP
ncbi:TPA: hypothetical protein NIB84_000758 [Pseudomonas aeruginosa]|nr:hypothetical protein [Pseudomonas aeruginosa]HCE7545678.1 hypothetical protein [Pseudomonas aeruginosa]HCE7574780.1 hypothetical protein [Pseudomonas aeruginosa]HCE7847220.1 hypothetical protein [Pseudomonas aeruginosa]HCE7918656.1 hypothetical protein [Pseudomonas aeruginosa]